MKQSKYLTNDERESLERICRESLDKAKSSGDAIEYRNAVFILTALNCGMRVSELLNLKMRDVDFDNKVIYLRSLKNGIDRDLPAPKEFLDYADKRRAEKYVFDIGYQRIVQIWNFYRPVKKTFHALRHTFAMRLMRRTKNIRKVQYALGHKNLSSTGIYLEEQYKPEDMKRDFGIK